LGLTIIFIASKYEDVKFITLYQCINTIGRSKFKQKEILDTERDILVTLSYKVGAPTLYTETAIELRRALLTSKHYRSLEKEETSLFASYLAKAERFQMFLSLLVTMSAELRHIEIK
jgi:hypothetical protein